MLESIHWRLPVRWEIARISVLKPIDMALHPAGAVDCAGPRMLALKDVAYVIEARLGVVGELESLEKHRRRFERRVRGGEPFRRPYFGVRECPADFRLLTDSDPPLRCPPELAGERDWGWLAYDQDNARDRPTRFIRARSVDGVIDITAAGEAQLYG